MRQGDDILGHGYPHVRDAERRGILAGEKGQPRGHADWVLYEVVVEVEPLAGEAVQVGRVDLGVAVGTERVVALLVGIEQENIGASHIVDLTIVLVCLYAGLLDGETPF